MKFVHLISRGLRQICSIFNHDLQIEYRNEITRKNNVEKDLRNLTNKKNDISSQLSEKEINKEKNNISKSVEKKSIARFLRKFIKIKNGKRKEKLRYYFMKWHGEQRKKYKKEKFTRTIKVRIEYSKKKEINHSLSIEKKEKNDKNEMKKTEKQKTNINKNDSITQNNKIFKIIPITKQNLNQNKNKNRTNNKSKKFIIQNKNNDNKKVTKQIKSNNIKKDTLKSKTFLNNSGFSNNIIKPTKKILNKDKKTKTNNYVRIPNTFIPKKIFHRDNNPCSTNCNNYRNNDIFIQNNIFNCLNNDNNSNRSRGKIYIISDDSLCKNSNNIESYQITNEYYISSKNNNFRNLFCSQRKINNDESINFKENISENIASYDINHRIKKINISQKENQIRYFS